MFVVGNCEAVGADEALTPAHPPTHSPTHSLTHSRTHSHTRLLLTLTGSCTHTLAHTLAGNLSTHEAHVRTLRFTLSLLTFTHFASSHADARAMHEMDMNSHTCVRTCVRAYVVRSLDLQTCRRTRNKAGRCAAVQTDVGVRARARVLFFVVLFVFCVCVCVCVCVFFCGFVFFFLFGQLAFGLMPFDPQQVAV